MVLGEPNAGVVRVDAVPFYEGSPLFTFKLTASIPNPPEIADAPYPYETQDAAREGAVALLRQHCTVRAVYPKDGGSLREAVGRAMLGLETGTDPEASLKQIVQWMLDALKRTVIDLIRREVVSHADAPSVYEALRYFALTGVVGFPSDFIPDPWLDRLPTMLLVEMAQAGGALAELYKAEVLRREGKIARWEFVRLGSYEARVRIVSVPETLDTVVTSVVNQPKVVQ